jgi:hypothetical protein
MASGLVAALNEWSTDRPSVGEFEHNGLLRMGSPGFSVTPLLMANGQPIQFVPDLPQGLQTCEVSLDAGENCAERNLSAIVE